MATKSKVLIITTSLLIGLAFIFLLGPRVKIDTTLETIDLPEDLDAYLAREEGRFHDIVPGAEKTIIWAGERGQKTHLSIIYLHGFSATRQEVAPLCDQIAAKLGANLFYTRFTGHGRTGQALAQAQVNDWLRDSQEALAIGKRLGERVIVIAVSTGAAAATWLATQPESADVLAFVLISPNYGLHGNTNVMLWPWGEHIINTILGPERHWEPDSAGQAKYWTHRYPTKALLPMMGLVNLARNSNLEAVTVPTQIIYSPNDKTVDPKKAEAMFGRFGSKIKQLIPIDQVEDHNNHVLAGDLRSPGDTERIKNLILSFLTPLLHA